MNLSKISPVAVFSLMGLSMSAGFGIGLSISDQDIAKVLGLDGAQVSVLEVGNDGTLKCNSGLEISTMGLSQSIGIDGLSRPVPDGPGATFYVFACPKCGKNMIRRFTDQALLSYPPQFPWKWWCGCGHIEPGGIIKEKSDSEIALDAWKAAQGHDLSKGE